VKTFGNLNRFKLGQPSIDIEKTVPDSLLVHGIKNKKLLSGDK